MLKAASKVRAKPDGISPFATSTNCLVPRYGDGFAPQTRWRARKRDLPRDAAGAAAPVSSQAPRRYVEAYCREKNVETRIVSRIAQPTRVPVFARDPGQSHRDTTFEIRLTPSLRKSDAAW